ncbi:MAG: hypothetical protein JST64_05670 [Actinobacteria bacterium]|nr:hypothetical protein [Actinomycetota bacterium]
MTSAIPGTVPPGTVPPGAVPPGAVPPGQGVGEGTPKRRRHRLLIGVLAALLVIAGGVAALLITRTSASAPKATLDVCTIDADGSLKASGALSGSDGPMKVTVEFRNTKDHGLLSRGSGEANVVDGRSAGWKVTGRTDSDAPAVICTVTKVSS